jgi:hypothetical protein
MIFDLLSINGDCNFTDKIKESDYIESVSHNGVVSTTPSEVPIRSYPNFISCIISEFDPIIQTINVSEKKLYLSQKIMAICSKIDESDSHYRDYKFNEKTMKSHLIRRGLQMGGKSENQISSIYYLNEFYKQHFVIVYQNIAYDTTLKSYPKIYLNLNRGVRMIDEMDFMKGDLNDLFDKISLVNDIKKDMKSVYKLFLDPISKCKMDDLKKVASECNISLKDGKKNKIKSRLYDEINLYKLNE